MSSIIFGVEFYFSSFPALLATQQKAGRGEAVSGVLEQGATCQRIFTITSSQVIKTFD